MTRSTRPTVPRCWKTLQRKRPRPGTEYAMSISRLSLNFCFWRLLMMENAMAMVSSCMRRLVSTRGTSSPLMRSTGCDPTFRWRSDALRSEAIFRRSLMCIGSPPPRAAASGPGRLASAGTNVSQPCSSGTRHSMTSKNASCRRFGDRAARARADHEPVHRTDGRDLGRGAGEEELVGEVEHLAGQRAPRRPGFRACGRA